MDEDHHNELKSAAKERYRSKVSAAKDEYKKAIESIEHVRRLEKLDGRTGDLVVNGPRPRRIGLMAAVRSAIEEIDGAFTSEAIVGHLKKNGQTAIRASVASALGRLAEDPNGGIETLVHPSGRRAGIYQKKRIKKEEDWDSMS